MVILLLPAYPTMPPGQPFVAVTVAWLAQFVTVSVPEFTFPTMPPTPALLLDLLEVTLPENEQFLISTEPCVKPTMPPTLTVEPETEPDTFKF